MAKEFVGFNHGTSPVDLRPLSSRKKVIQEFRPTEIHLKENGSKDDKPSIVIVMELPNHLGELSDTIAVYGQLSLRMLNDGLKDIGYEIKKIK